jgi:chromate transporter
VGVLPALVAAFLKIGLIGFGGGNNLIPLVQAEVVPRWMTADEFTELVGVNFAFPGLSVIKLAGVVGLRAGGIPGLILSVASLTLPGVVLMAGAYTAMMKHRENLFVQKFLTAMKYATPALLAVTAFVMLRSVIEERPDVGGVLLMGGLFAAMYWLGLSPLLAVLLAGVVGLLIF